MMILLNTLDSIIEWNKAFIIGKDIKTLTLKQIDEFDEH